MNILNEPTLPPPVPTKRNKLHAMFLRAMDRRAAKKRGSVHQQKAKSLFVARQGVLHDIRLLDAEYVLAAHTP